MFTFSLKIFRKGIKHSQSLNFALGLISSTVKKFVFVLFCFKNWARFIPAIPTTGEKEAEVSKTLPQK
jgi:hypothetical protein